MKIIFACRSFSGVAGGVERMSIALMNEMVSRGHQVHLLTWDRVDGSTAFFDMDPRVVWHKMGIGDPRERAGIKIRLYRALKVWRLARYLKPDVGIGFQHGPFLALWAYTIGLRFPVICAERNSLDRMNYNDRVENPSLAFNTMRFARFITVQCESYRESYPVYLRKKIRVIPNPVFPASGKANPSLSSSGKYTLLAVGRLAYQKNFECLVNAFALIAEKIPDWNLVIIGNGEKRGALEEIVDLKSLTGRVFFKGALPSAEVNANYIAAHLFCLPSRWEGFPNVLAEAMAHGLPCVGFSECTGVRDLIRSGDNGLLAAGIDNAETLSESLLLMMSNADERQRIGASAAQDVIQYNPKRIFDEWERVFRDAKY